MHLLFFYSMTCYGLRNLLKQGLQTGTGAAALKNQSTVAVVPWPVESGSNCD